MSTVRYASAVEYGDRQPGSDASDSELPGELIAASRLVDKQLHVEPGHFAPHDATYRFTGSGQSRLWLRDDGGLAYGLRSVVTGGITIDLSGDGVYDGYAWDFGDPWVLPSPLNAVEYAEPYFALDLRVPVASSRKTWPELRAAIKIEGAWGWPATPDIVKSFTIARVRDVRDGIKAGGAGVVAQLDDGTPLSETAWRLWLQVANLYGRRESRHGAVLA